MIDQVIAIYTIIDDALKLMLHYEDPRRTFRLVSRKMPCPLAEAGKALALNNSLGSGGKLLDSCDFLGLLALRPLRNVETDLLTLFEALEALHVDRREVREEVFAAVVRGDEAVTFCVVEPLDRAGCHTTCSSQE